MKRLLAALVAFSLYLHGGALGAAAQFKMVTATEGADFQLGHDLARFVAPAADIELEVFASGNSAENLRRLRSEPGVKLATVQSDVYQTFLDQAARGNAAAAELVRPLRVVVPLYREEIHFIARADVPGAAAVARVPRRPRGDSQGGRGGGEARKSEAVAQGQANAR